jgi:hypothetical protein
MTSSRGRGVELRPRYRTGKPMFKKALQVHPTTGKAVAELAKGERSEIEWRCKDSEWSVSWLRNLLFAKVELVEGVMKPGVAYV